MVEFKLRKRAEKKRRRRWCLNEFDKDTICCLEKGHVGPHKKWTLAVEKFTGDMTIDWFEWESRDA